MGFFVVFLAVVAASAALEDDGCPPASELSPCTCDREGVNCMDTVTVDQIKRAFKSNFKYKGVRAIWIQGTRLDSVSRDLINNIKTQHVYIEVNNVTTVDYRAFDGSEGILNTLSLFSNKLSSFDFAGLARFKALGTLNLGKNKLTSIPANAFKNEMLHTLILADNQITTIGMDAFVKLSNLLRLEMAYNSLTNLGTRAITTPSPFAQISLMNNKISDVATSAFDGAQPQVLLLAGNKLTSFKYESFGGIVNRMGNHGGLIEVSGNPFSCRGCTFSWLVNNKIILSRMLLGFKCQDGKGLLQLTRTNIGC